jgi:alcohol dehydrogenase
MTRMQAAVLRPGPDASEPDFSRLAVEEVELHAPRDGEALVEVAYASLCHSDLSVLTGDRPRPLPMVLGHEASGRVVAVGSGTGSVRPGQHVVFTYVPACGHCRFCRDGRPVLCSVANASNTAGELVGGGSRLNDASGASIHHHLGVSAFAEYAVVDHHSLLPVPEDVPLRQAALFGCAVTTGVGAVLNAAKVGLGRSAAVFGCGGVGLAAVLGLRAVGAAPILAVDVNPEALAVAREVGADITLPSGPDTAAEIVELTDGGVEFAIDASGALPAIDTAHRSLMRGGQLVLVGLPHPSAQWMVSPAALVANDITVRGSYMGSSVPVRDVARFVELHRRGRLAVEGLVRSTISLGDVPAGLARLHAGVAGRTVVELAGSAD